MKRLFRKKPEEAVLVWLAVTLLACAVLLLGNLLVTKLTDRYSLRTTVSATPDYSVSDECYALLDRTLAPSGKSLTILFLQKEETIKEDTAGRYILGTAEELAARYPSLQVDFCDPIEDPLPLRKYTVVRNAVTGEVQRDEDGNEQTRTLPSSGFILISEDYYRVYDAEECFSFEGGNLSSVRAYIGESKLAAGILHALRPLRQAAYLTTNHGESFADYELLYLLDDAGYAVDYIDLSKEEIPASCRLLVTVAPTSDFLDGEGSECERLAAFLSGDGNHYLLFASSATPRMEALEGLLDDWGVSFAYSAPDAAGRSYRYSVKDDGASLTSDGYSIRGSADADLVDGVKDAVIFRGSTAIRVASGFVNQGEGVYKSNDKTLYTLYRASRNATAYAGGRQVDAGPAILMTFTERMGAGGASSVAVVASTVFCEEDYLQSAVYGNRDALLRLSRLFGAGDTPEGLPPKPFSSDRMSLVTTAQKLSLSLILTLVPILLSAGAGLMILLRRRR